MVGSPPTGEILKRCDDIVGQNITDNVLASKSKLDIQ